MNQNGCRLNGVKKMKFEGMMNKYTPAILSKQSFIFSILSDGLFDADVGTKRVRLKSGLDKNWYPTDNKLTQIKLEQF
jgi:hypothetical protein